MKLREDKNLDSWLVGDLEGEKKKDGKKVKPRMIRSSNLIVMWKQSTRSCMYVCTSVQFFTWCRMNDQRKWKIIRLRFI